ncbi:SIMPL domain-containing protein [Pyruvatibacter sp.]|uniref:SIMPL domain-containing protein n=1 Tax=Pyruvatibacter sp. TaxID=1981328 RepID=UPI0032EC6682
MNSGPFGFLGAIVLAAGVAFAGWQVGTGFFEGRKAERYVTVKGLAERDVRADLAMWRLRYTATGNDLAQVQAQIDQNTNTITTFLTSRGVQPDEISLERLEVTDLLAQAYRSGGIGEARYIIAQNMLLRTPDVDLVDALGRETGELVRRGVVLADLGGPTYSFNGLNDIKPELIAQATAAARTGAAEFAANSGSQLGGILRANQGVIVIRPRDDTGGVSEESQLEKTVRVVATVDYSLSD